MTSADVPFTDPGPVPPGNDTAIDITSKADELFRAVFDSLDAGLVLATLKGRIIETNAHFARMLGYEPDELTGRSFTEITHEDDIERSLDSRDKAQASGTGGYTFDKRYLRKDGSTCWTRITVLAVRNTDGAPICNLGIIDDLTSTRIVEQQLRFQGQLLDNVSESVVATDLEGYVTFWGRGAEALYGYPADEAMGKPVTIIVPPGEEPTERERMQTVYDKGSWRGQYLQRRRDGSTFWADTMISLVRGADGQPVGYVGIDRDITDRLAAEEALRRSEEKFRMLAENIREVFWMSNLEEPATFFVSPAYEEVWGRSCESLYKNPRSFLDAVHADDRPCVERAVERQLAAQNTIEEYRILRPDGSIRWIRDRGFPVIGEDGRVVRVVGIAEDITETRAAAKRRRELEARVQHTQRLESLGVLAGGIAHDFNNLLTGIIGNAGLARSMVSPDSSVGDYLTTIETAGRRAAELSHLMLAYSGRAPLQASKVNLSQVVGELESLIHAALPKSTTVELDLMPEIPAVLADIAQVRQVVMNLLTNAGEALPDEGGVITMKTGVVAADRDELAGTYVDDSLPPGNYVFLEIRDCGCGMDDATLSRVFDPFFTTKFTGRGLGLAAVLGIVRAHQGAISFDSSPGHGTTARVLFPSLEEASIDAEITAETDAPAHYNSTILIVDDERVVRETGASLLRHGGYRVLEAESGEDALQILEENSQSVDGVLLDLTMPGLDGHETYRRLREVDPDVKVVLCSGYSDVELAQRFGADGYAGFLHKPYGLRELLTAVQDL